MPGHIRFATSLFDPLGLGARQCGQHLDCRGLARAILAQKANDFVLCGIHRKGVNVCHPIKTLGQAIHWVRRCVRIMGTGMGGGFLLQQVQLPPLCPPQTPRAFLLTCSFASSGIFRHDGWARKTAAGLCAFRLVINSGIHSRRKSNASAAALNRAPARNVAGPPRRQAVPASCPCAGPKPPHRPEPRPNALNWPE